MQIPKIDWDIARTAYEAGASQGEVARQFGVSRRAVQKRIEAEGWTQNLKSRISRETEARVIGIAPTDGPATREKLVEDEATKRADLIRRHRLEWDFIRSYMSGALAKAATLSGGKLVIATGEDYLHALRSMRLAKLATETVRERQMAERMAFGLDQHDDDDDDEDDLTPEQLAIRISQILNAAEHDATPKAKRGVQ